MIVFDSLHHVAVPITDLTRSRAFYSGVLGLTEVPRPDFDFDGAWYRVGDQQLHLIVHPPGVRGDSVGINSRNGHLALRVRSYRDTLDHLRARGIPCTERPRNKTPWPQIYVADPDGNVIELNAERLDL